MDFRLIFLGLLALAGCVSPLPMQEASQADKKEAPPELRLQLERAQGEISGYDTDRPVLPGRQGQEFRNAPALREVFTFAIVNPYDVDLRVDKKDSLVIRYLTPRSTTISFRLQVVDQASGEILSDRNRCVSLCDGYEHGVDCLPPIVVEAGSKREFSVRACVFYLDEPSIRLIQMKLARINAHYDRRVTRLREW